MPQLRKPQETESSEEYLTETAIQTGVGLWRDKQWQEWASEHMNGNQ